VKISVHDLGGATVGEVELDDSVFGVPFRQAVVHQAVTCLLANRRQGTAATKTRGEVTGSTRKLYAQKGTGRARRGSIKSPLMRGGGIVFGPSPRSYRQRLPKKMRRLAFACALSEKARDGAIWAVENLDFGVPRTKDVAALLASAGKVPSVLIVVPESQPVLALSARNLPGTTVRQCSVVSTLDVMSSDKLIASVSALRKMEEIWGSKGSSDESA
jgi:large subunit ribosomal protein L4